MRQKLVRTVETASVWELDRVLTMATQDYERLSSIAKPTEDEYAQLIVARMFKGIIRSELAKRNEGII